MEIVSKQTIDIDKILNDKMGKKAKYVPRPLVTWLKRIIHQDEVNRYLWESRHLQNGLKNVYAISI